MAKLQEAVRIKLCTRRDRMDRRGFHSVLHQHPFYELALMERGSCRWTLGSGKALELGEGHCLLLPPGTPHREDMEGEADGRIAWIGFDGPEPGDWAPSCLKKTDLRAAAEEMMALYRWVEREWNAPGPEAEGLAVRALEMLLILVRRHARGAPAPGKRGKAVLNGRQSRIVRAAAAYFEQNPGLPRSVEQAARLHSLSVSHFSALFRKWHGQGPREYVQQLRLRRTTHLLKTTDLSVKEIAALSGYVDAAHFCRHYKKQKGMAPGRFRTLARRK
jgi:AraC-like DNA-binding protein